MGLGLFLYPHSNPFIPYLQLRFYFFDPPGQLYYIAFIFFPLNLVLKFDIAFKLGFNLLDFDH